MASEHKEQVKVGFLFSGRKLRKLLGWGRGGGGGAWVIWCNGGGEGGGKRKREDVLIQNHRDARKKPISSSKAVFRMSSCWLFKKRLFGMLRNGMADLKTEKDLMVSVGLLCLEG